MPYRTSDFVPILEGGRWFFCLIKTLCLYLCSYCEISTKMSEKKDFVNPIDKDKIAENPHSLPYAHTVGGSVIKPVDEGAVKGKAIRAMEQQTDMQMDQIKMQIELLAEQARAIQKRKEISEMIYDATLSFEPLIGHTYHLYEREDEITILSLISPREWGRSKTYQRFVATVRLLADHTWDVLEEG